jgi:hypothetical protein
MDKFKILVAESISADDFYERDWEGYVVEEIVRLLGGRTFYRIGRWVRGTPLGHPGARHPDKRPGCYRFLRWRAARRFAEHTPVDSVLPVGLPDHAAHP